MNVIHNVCHTYILSFFKKHFIQPQVKPPKATLLSYSISSLRGALMTKKSALLGLFSLSSKNPRLTLVCGSFSTCWSSGSESESPPLDCRWQTWLPASDSDSDIISCRCKRRALSPAVSLSVADSLPYVRRSPLGTSPLHWAAEGCARSTWSCWSTSGL